MPPAVTNGTPATARPRIATTTVPPAKTTACPAVATARAIDSSTVSPEREVLPVPGDQEQRVVDPDPEADHAAELGRPAGDVHHVGDQRHRADADGEAEERHPDRKAHRDQRAEGHEQDERGGEHADQLARACSPRRRRTARRPSRGAGARPRWPRHRRPSARARSAARDVREHRIADLDARDPPVLGHHGVARAEHVRQRRRPLADLRAALPAPRASRSAPCAASGPAARSTRPGRSRPAQQLRGLLGVQSRHLEGVLELAAERPGGADHEHGRDEPGTDDGPWPAGREPAQSVQGMRQGLLRRRACILDRTPVRAHRMSGSNRLARSDGADLVLIGRFRRGSRVLYAGAVVDDAVRSLWAEPRAPGAPARVWRDWALVAVLLPAAVLETVLRDDLVWPGVALVLAVAHAFSLLWRRTHPLAVVAFAFGTGTAVGVAAFFGPGESVGLYSSICVLVLPYALFRWGSGREIALGVPIIVLAYVIGVAGDWTGAGDALGGARRPDLPGGARRLGPHLEGLPAARARPGQAARARAAGAGAARHGRAPRLRDRHPGAGRADRRRRASRSPRCEALEVIEEEASRTLAEMRTLVGALRDGRRARAGAAAGRGRHRAARSRRRRTARGSTSSCRATSTACGRRSEPRSTGSRRSRSPTRCGTPADATRIAVSVAGERGLRPADGPRRRRRPPSAGRTAAGLRAGRHDRAGRAARRHARGRARPRAAAGRSAPSCPERRRR